MLSTNSTSSIRKRRQQHRRQQSLEVPLLATPLPANTRRTKPAIHGHRRGLSLDQSLSALNSPTGFRPLLPQDQDQDQFQGPPPVRIQIDTTNTGHQPTQQHFVQDPQTQRPAQPGYPAQDFQSHLQQQLNGRASPVGIVSPTPTHPPSHEQALQDLQQHLEWYTQHYGHSPAPIMQTDNTTIFTLDHPATDQMAMNPNNPHITQQQQPVVGLPHSPVPHPLPRTVPNTPQHHVRDWPSPPLTDVKHVRSQSFQFDVAPMPPLFEGRHIMKTGTPYSQPHDSFQDSFTMGEDYTYASSAYSSSNIDPMSPGRQHNEPMPTLFEEHDGLNGDNLLLQAAAGADMDDFNSPNFMVGDAGMSPRTAMLHNLGEDVNATIVDTGIDAEEVERNITDLDPNTQQYHCLYVEDGKKCNKHFKRRENARSHVQNHLGDRQFQCNDCGKTFVRQHDMKRHAAIHKDDRPHTCPCGSKFARQDALTRHRQRGMCVGTLPGFEKTEEDKPKRGRPKKERPDQKSRTDKAKKARQMDRGNYASSSSAMSDHSLPMTPPDTSDDFDADVFINMENVAMDYHHTTSSWRDTPPTSPASAQEQGISPALLSNKGTTHATVASSFTGDSSPLHFTTDDSFHFGAIESQPGVATQELFSDAFSPSNGYTDASSPFTADDMAEMEKSGGFFMGQMEMEPASAHNFGPLLDWLEAGVSA